MNEKTKKIFGEIEDRYHLDSKVFESSDVEDALRELPEYLGEIIQEYNSTADKFVFRNDLLFAATKIVHFIAVMDGVN
ncbi:hypothetical protein [Leptospira brenneri]|uniref:hypothetical protein n=1 Tax=Leptospira brenneri TaxID=2023182 RepID=UPI000C2A6878|nr:hypothetical protein [Leptospira brenneri]PJZ43707.1 hypothetical protein CH361_19205 [Leptospira brenneri]